MNEIALDIETSGLASDDEVVSIAMYAEIDYETDVIYQDVVTPEREILQALQLVISNMTKGTILITFNGQNFKYGFDYPFLRTRLNKHGLDWPFAGIMHIDLFPIIEKRWNTSIMPKPSLDRLKRKEQLVTVATALGLDLNPTNTLAVLSNSIRKHADEEDIKSAIIETQDIKPIEINNLKGAYQIITGKDPGDMDGMESVRLWKQFKKTGDSSIMRRIGEYNLEDCKKTLELYKICKRYCSQRDMQPEIL